MKSTLLLAIAAGLSATISIAPSIAVAQDYPERTVTIIVPYPPGGSADLIGRMLADQLNDIMDQTVIVENRGGASGAIGSEAVARANPDGHTLLIGIGDTHAINPAVNPNLSYDALADFEPISLLARQPLALAVGPSVEAETFEDFLQAAQSEPGSIFYASNGTGGMQHLSMLSLEAQADFEAVHVPFPGSGPAMADLIGGHVDAIFISLQGGGANFDAGTIRALAISSSERLDVAPEVPTFAELGLEEFQAEQWYGLFAPAGTPPELVELISGHASDAIMRPEVADSLGASGTQAVGSSSDEFEAFLAEQIDIWAEIAGEHNITAE